MKLHSGGWQRSLTPETAGDLITSTQRCWDRKREGKKPKEAKELKEMSDGFQLLG